MKSAELYKRIKERLGPWAKAEGFKPLKRVVGWSRPLNSQTLVVRVGTDSRSPWDEYAGAGFFLAFEIGTAGNEDLRNRVFFFWDLLTPEQLEHLRVIHNRIIASLPQPPEDHPALKDDRTKDYYRAKFEPAAVLDPKMQIWLRYYKPEDIDTWADFLHSLMSHFVREVSSRAN